jgi:PAS domain S-box-containing protein
VSRSLSWRELTRVSRLYLLGVYLAAIPAAFVCLYWLPGEYSLSWFVLTLTSLLMASVNVRLPKSATVVISMGDVFTILALIYFGSGPALVILWSGILTAIVTDYVRRHGIHFYRKILLYRLAFNLAASPLAILPMSLLYSWAMNSGLAFPADMVAALGLVAASWFVVNTLTLAAAVSFWSEERFWDVWKNGLGLYLLNFSGSAACAGLIAIFYGVGDIYVVLLAAPVALLLQRLYSYHVAQYDQAQAHIQQLNDLYQAAIRTQEAQNRSEARYRSLVEAASDAIFSLSPDRRFMSLNTAFKTITGWETEEWLGRPFEDLMHPEDVTAARKVLTDVLQGQTLLLPELRLARKTGGHVVVECTATPHARGGEAIGLIGIARDMTERKRLEESLRQSQKMEAIGRLAGGVAHDLNNILVVILGYSELLGERLGSANRSRQMVEAIRRAGEQAAGLTRQLLAFSRKQLIKPELLDLNAVVTKMDLMLRRVIGEDIELVNVLDTRIGAVKADPSQIEQVILNLAVNARDAMPTGGKLTVETRVATTVEVSRIVKTTARPGRYVMLAITDNGSGIPVEIQSLVFEPFFTTKEVGKGTGLGLATVYGIVNQAGGYLSLESAVDKGTSIRIFLPRIDEEVQMDETPKQISGRDMHETVLLVEDEDAVRGLATALLKRDGYNVLEAGSGEQALKIARQHPGPIDALVTDIVMPKMSGRELAETVLALRREIKVLYMSGYSDEVISHHGVIDGGTAFLQKPFRPDEFVQKVHDLLRSNAG